MSAVERFNERFGFHFTEPVDDHTRGMMMAFARESGRSDLAERLAAEAGEIGRMQNEECRMQNAEWGRPLVSTAENILETARVDLGLCEANVVRARHCERPLAVPFKQMALDASRQTRAALERFERELEKELFA